MGLLLYTGTDLLKNVVRNLQKNGAISFLMIDTRDDRYICAVFECLHLGFKMHVYEEKELAYTINLEFFPLANFNSVINSTTENNEALLIKVLDAIMTEFRATTNRCGRFVNIFCPTETIRQKPDSVLRELKKLAAIKK